jgi:hypothetical protein
VRGKRQRSLSEDWRPSFQTFVHAGTLKKLSQRHGLFLRCAAIIVVMKYRPIAIFLLFSLLATLVFAKKLDWQAVENIPRGTIIEVTIHGAMRCMLQRVTEDKLFCTLDYPGSSYRPSIAASAGSSYSGPNPDLVYNRAEIKAVCTGERCASPPYDYSKGYLSLVAAAGAGGGWDSGSEPTSFAGVKVGLEGAALDLQYDRLRGQNGFATEGSAVLPFFRIPRFHPEKDRLFVRAWAEPGLGYRAGRGPFGGYTSAKMLLLFGNRWLDGKVSPYVEYQHRFPFNAPLSGDNRVAIGIMLAVCEHCGLE